MQHTQTYEKKYISFRCQAFNRWWIFQLRPQILVVCKGGSGECPLVSPSCSFSLQAPPFQESALWEADIDSMLVSSLLIRTK